MLASCAESSLSTSAAAHVCMASAMRLVCVRHSPAAARRAVAVLVDRLAAQPCRCRRSTCCAPSARSAPAPCTTCCTRPPSAGSSATCRAATTRRSALRSIRTFSASHVAPAARRQHERRAARALALRAAHAPPSCEASPAGLAPAQLARNLPHIIWIRVALAARRPHLAHVAVDRHGVHRGEERDGRHFARRQLLHVTADLQQPSRVPPPPCTTQSQPRPAAQPPTVGRSFYDAHPRSTWRRCEQESTAATTLRCRKAARPGDRLRRRCVRRRPPSPPTGSGVSFSNAYGSFWRPTAEDSKGA